MPKKVAVPPPFPWPSKIVGYGIEAVATLVENRKNWRGHPPAQLAPLLGLLSTVGVVQNLIVNKRTDPQWPEEEQGKPVLVDGHARVLLAREHGQPALPVTYVDLTPNEENQVLLLFDPLGGLIEAQRDQLAVLLRETQTGDAALQQMLSDLAAHEGIVPPDFQPVGVEEQGRLDQKQPITCPHCGTEFTV